MSDMKKRTVRENPIKIACPREQGMVKTKLEIVEVERPHSILTYAVCIVH